MKGGWGWGGWGGGGGRKGGGEVVLGLGVCRHVIV
jgi:hypothetical protein